MKNQRQPLDILKEAAAILNGVDGLARCAMELADNQNYASTPAPAVEKIIRARLAVHGVSQEQIETFVAQYHDAKLWTLKGN